MTRAHTITALLAGLLFPLIASAQDANAKADPKSPTADKLPIYEIDPNAPSGPAVHAIKGELEALAPTRVAVQARVKGLK